jgi:hypothetical protein
MDMSPFKLDLRFHLRDGTILGMIVLIASLAFVHQSNRKKVKKERAAFQNGCTALSNPKMELQAMAHRIAVISKDGESNRFTSPSFSVLNGSNYIVTIVYVDLHLVTAQN